jgi:hypothetical protein
MTAPELEEISGNQRIVFRQRMINVDHEGGAKIYAALMGRNNPAEQNIVT